MKLRGLISPSSLFPFLVIASFVRGEKCAIFMSVEISITYVYMLNSWTTPAQSWGVSFYNSLCLWWSVLLFIRPDKHQRVPQQDAIKNVRVVKACIDTVALTCHTTGVFSSDLYRSLVCDMKKLGFFPINFTLTWNIIHQHYANRWLKHHRGNLPGCFFNLKK